MRGTPSLVLIDGLGRMRANHFGQVSDMQAAYQITKLIHENGLSGGDQISASDTTTGVENGCVVT